VTLWSAVVLVFAITRPQILMIAAAVALFL
jgi:hypothetical protein